MYHSNSRVSTNDGDRRRPHNDQERDGRDSRDKDRRSHRDYDKDRDRRRDRSRDRDRHHNRSKYDDGDRRRRDRSRSRSRERDRKRYGDEDVRRSYNLERKHEDSSNTRDVAHEMQTQQYSHGPTDVVNSNYRHPSREEADGQQPSPPQDKISSSGGGAVGISMKLAPPPAPKPSLPVPTTPLVQKSAKVAAIFNDDDDDEPEEMPPECKMRMKNVGRDTPTSAGPNSFGKTKLGFCNTAHLDPLEPPPIARGGPVKLPKWK